jgi:hypothetical protein
MHFFWIILKFNSERDGLATVQRLSLHLIIGRCVHTEVLSLQLAYNYISN